MLLNHEPKRQRRAAFTLMEMLVVVAIIVALAGIGGFFLLGQLEGAKKDTAQTQVKVTLSQACEAYSIKHGHFPDSLAALLVKDEIGGPYLKSEDYLYDPWSTPSNKRPYQYDASGTKNQSIQPDIWTTTPDGTVIIGNWPAKNR